MNHPPERSETFVVMHGQIPGQLARGILYVNPQSSRAHHLCACGCGQRVLTPLNDLEWELSGSDEEPSLHPSVGNWNLDCKSHYILRSGRVRWARRFSSREIEACRRKDLQPYVESGWFEKIKSWIRDVAKFCRLD